jgi:RND family efflux transporter MFP subunit
MTVKKASIILIIFAIFAAILVTTFIVKNSNNEEYTLATVDIANIKQTVNETGTLRATKELNLSFPSSGKLEKIYFEIGDSVKAGEIIAELDFKDLLIKKNEASANVDVAEENLKKLIAGATREEIAIEKAQLEQAETAYNAAKSEYEKIDKSTKETMEQTEKTLLDLESSSSDTITTYEQAIKSAADNLSNTKRTQQKQIDDKVMAALTVVDDKFIKINTSLDVINSAINDDDFDEFISKKDPKYLELTKSQYANAKEKIEELTEKFITVKTEKKQDEVYEMLDDVFLLLDTVSQALLNCYKALENSITSTSFPQSQIDTLKTNVSAQQTIISTAITATDSSKTDLNDAILNYDIKVSAASNTKLEAESAYDNALINAKNSYNNAQIARDQQLDVAQSKIDSTYKALQVANAQYNKINAPANKYDISLAEAKIRQAEAAFETIENQLENSVIKASVDGIITDVIYEVGEQVIANQTAIKLLGESDFEIEVLISEADIAKVTLGNKVEITLDSYGDDVKFNGDIIFIEPAETIIQDVIYYKVEISFDANKYEIKSGMTANATITTAEKENVLVIPSRAVIEKNGSGKFARTLINGEIVEQKVEIGIRGDDGVLELISGVNEGDTVVTYIKKQK